MHKYRRVTYEDRCQIKAMLASGFSRSSIAIELNFHKSTISREVLRNQFNQIYSAHMAHSLAKERKALCKRRSVISSEHVDQIIDWLKFGFSPEQISGRLRREKTIFVGKDSLYRFIRTSDKGLEVYLRRHGRRGGGRIAQRKGKRSQFKSIHERPNLVKKRTRLGDWERDGMYLAERNQLLVHNERKSRYVIISKMGKGKPKITTQLSNQALKSVPIKSYSLTNDNGPEFRDSKNVIIPTYHCDVGKPQQRGTIENTIGLLRQYITRQQTERQLTKAKIQKIEDRLNFRPRKCLDYKTPFEVLFGVTVALAT